MLGIMHLKVEKKKKSTSATCEKKKKNPPSLHPSPNLTPLSSHLPLTQLLLEIRPIISSDGIIFARQQIISPHSFPTLFFLSRIDFRQQIKCVTRSYGVFML
jgi:hypothetical protein